MNSEKQHWTERKQGGHASLAFLALLVKIFPHFLLVLIAVPVSFFYYLFDYGARKEALRYQKNMILFSKKTALKRAHPWVQILSFALCLIEKMEGWSGKTGLEKLEFMQDDVRDIKLRLSEGKGAVVIASHLGNMELLRCFSNLDFVGDNRTFSVTAVVDGDVSPDFMQVMQKINPSFKMDVINSKDFSPATVEELESCIERGSVLMIAGDRSSSASKHNITESFLGKEAQFPYGAFFIASILKAPVYYVFGLRKKTFSFFRRYRMCVHKSAINLECSRKERDSRIKALCAEFRNYLESYCKKYPYQWYNFYNFWLKNQNPDIGDKSL